MLPTVALPLILLFAAPEVSEPERIFQQFVSNLRKQDLLAAWYALGPKLRKKLGRGLREEVDAADDADMREVIEAFKTKMGTSPSNPMKLLTTLKVTVSKVEAKKNRAVLTVSTTTEGFPGSGLVVMVKQRGKWLLDDIKQAGDRNMGERGARANEVGAISTLRNLVSAQAQFQASAILDQNNNGYGEYGTFGEMAGAAVLRGREDKLNPPVLANRFGKTKNGRLTHSGYHFRLFLPGAKGVARNEKDAAAKVDVELAEAVWCVYAWPVKSGTTGNRAFFVNQMGDVLETEAGDYSGDKEPSPYAAFPADAEGKPAKSIAGDVKPGKKAGDGRVWKFAG